MIPTELIEDPQSVERGWANRQVWAIAMSAFFADLGYQAVIAGLPLFLVFDLHASAMTFALATAVGYGGGAIAGLIGGRWGDRFGHRRVSIAGNAFIPLLSLIGFVNVPFAAAALFVAGWWARNLRSPPRRALLVASVPSPGDRGRAFGLLHGLDVGGGMMAALAAIGLLDAGWSLSSVFLLTAAPLAVSTLILACLVSESPSRASCEKVDLKLPRLDRPPGSPGRNRPVAGVLIAATMFGFSFYSVGFPVLTVAQHSHGMVRGFLVFAIFSGVSGAVGFLVGQRRWSAVATLGVGGFGLSAMASIAIGVAAYYNLGFLALSLAVAALGAGLGVMETVEPTLIAALTPTHRHGAGMGNLAAARSVGLFIGNLMMGVLYVHGELLAYSYAAGAALLGAFIILLLGRGTGVTISS